MGEDFVIHYGADLSTVVSDLRKLERINSQVAKEFGNDFVKASAVVSNSLDKISQSTVKKKVGKEFKQLQKTIIQTGTIVKLTNGEFRKFGETQTFLNGKMQPVKTSLTNVTKQMRKQEEAAKKGGKATKTFAQNMAFLGKRALTVIPIWLVLRSVMTGFTRILSSSLKFLIDWEFQMAQMKIVGAESAETIEMLSDSMLNLASSLGVSNEQLGEACFDKETEILTDSGWKFFKDVTYIDKVLSMHPETRKSDYMPIKKIMEYDYDGELFCYNNLTNFKVTPNHRFLYTDDHQRKWFKDEIQNIKYNKFYIPLTSDWQGQTKRENWFFKVFASKKTVVCDNNTFMNFLGWYISEGSIVKDKTRKDTYRFIIGQTKRENLKEISATLQKMGFSGLWKEYANGFVHANKALCKYLLENCYTSKDIHNYSTKKIPEEIKNFDKQSLLILLNALIKGDGHNPSDKNSLSYFTGSKQLADDVQEIAIKCGYNATITIDRSEARKNILYNVYIATRSQNRRIFKKNITKEYYNDKVYCVETEPYNTIFVRRDGYSYWTLNSKLFIQQGRAASELLPLLDATAKLSLLTGRTTVQSVEDLTAILKAFRIDADKAITVVDLITNVMLNNAITAADLTAAYKQVASTASVLGISLAGLTGYITAIKAETRDAGGKIGLALRTMFTRITTVSADAIQQLSGIPLFLDEAGNATKTATNRFRNLDTVLSELSVVFDGLGSAQQIQLAKLTAGVRRTNQAIVLFKNFNQVIKAQTDALLGLGKADRAIATLTDTTKIRIQALTNTWKEFVDTVADTGVIKAAITFLKTQIEGLNALIDPDRAFYTGLSAELQKAGQEFQRNEQLAKNFTELMAMTGNLADQMGLAESANQFDLIRDRVQIIVSQIESFNRASPEIKIDIEPTLDPANLNAQLEAQREKFVDVQVKAVLDFERSQLQSDFISIGRELQLIFAKIPFKPGEDLSANADEIRNKFGEVSRIIGDITQGEFITQDQLDKVTLFAQRYDLTGEEVVGLGRKFDQLGDTQAKLIDSSGRELAVRKEISRNVDREIAKRRTAEQVTNDMFKLEIDSIRENKTKQQLLESQLKLLEQQDQVLTDQLEKRLKTIRKELEKIHAAEEQQILKTLINDQLERLRLAGALNSVITKRKTLLEDQFKVQRSFSENLARQLQLQRDITKEKRLSADKELSSETIKLFRIARDEGVETAKKIGDVLNKEISFKEFVRRGGDAVEIFKRDFGDIFEQEQAKAFFADLTVPDLKGLKGGARITTVEKENAAVLNSQSSLIDALLKVASAMYQFQDTVPKSTITTTPKTTADQISQGSVFAPQITTPINVNVDVSNLSELTEAVEDKLSQSITQVGTKVHEAVKNVVLKT